MFTELSEEEKESVAPELVGHTDKTLVKFDGKFWFVKKLRPPEHKKPDYLGWLLGKAIVNVAEVRHLSIQQINELISLPSLSQIGSTISSENTYLIRLASSYSQEELPLKTNDEAIAHELAYSVWIRRRDAHGLNRVYLQDIPIFFDHQTAFLGEPNLQSSDAFFKEPPTDYGQASAWRIVVREKEIKTLDGRSNFNSILHAGIFVHDTDEFKKNIQIALEKIQNIQVDSLLEDIKSAGYNDDEAQKIAQFLKNTQGALANDISIMESILFKPFQLWHWVA